MAIQGLAGPRAWQIEMTSAPQLPLQGRMIAFRADASLEIGSGHVMRCLTLANAMRSQGAECQFICREHPGHLCDVIETRGFTVHRLALQESSLNPGLAHAHWLGADWLQDAVSCEAILSELPPAWLVVDHYALDHRWEAAVLPKSTGSTARLLVIDDLANRKHAADLLLDQNLGRQGEDYEGLVPDDCRVLAGPRYALLRPEFREWREASLSRRTCQPRVKRLLINLGGVDNDNLTGRILEALTDCDLPNDLEIVVVMGASAPWRRSVATQAKMLPWPTEVVVNVSDMARRMAEADIAIGAAGSTSWERCCLGLPTLMLVLADNQESAASALQAVGAAHYIHTDALKARLSYELERLFMSSSSLKNMAMSSAAVCDGAGALRVVTILLEEMGEG